MKKYLHKLKELINSGFSKLSIKQRKLLIISLLILFIAADILYIVAGFRGKAMGMGSNRIDHVYSISLINYKNKNDIDGKERTEEETPSGEDGEPLE